MKIAVTGASGMLGRDVCAAVQAAGLTLASFSRAELGITDLNNVIQMVANQRPDAVIHCAAYTNVNGAEQNKGEAKKVNVDGTFNVAAACRRNGAKMIYVSTDFVFDGTKGIPYTENDLTNPLNVYGRTKWRGEKIVRALLPEDHVIARTSWLYGGPPETKNFVRTIQRLARTLPEVPVVCDQIGSPTCTVPVAQTLVALAADFVPGTYHVTCGGEASWFEFAREIVRLSGLQTLVVPITTAEYEARFPGQAVRPPYTPLDGAALRERGMTALPHWKDALTAFLSGDEATV